MNFPLKHPSSSTAVLFAAGSAMSMLISRYPSVPRAQVDGQRPVEPGSGSCSTSGSGDAK